jgi:hypothetical protein
MSFDRNKAEELLGTLFMKSLKLLIDRVMDGTASPSDVANALKVCRENGISLDITKGEPLDFLYDPVPFDADSDLQ